MTIIDDIDSSFKWLISSSIPRAGGLHYAIYLGDKFPKEKFQKPKEGKVLGTVTTVKSKTLDLCTTTVDLWMFARQL